MTSPAEGLARLRTAAENGVLDALCERHRISVLTAFGSAARGEPDARDLDLGMILAPGSRVDYPTLIGDLIDLTATNVDVVRLDGAGALIRERALVDAVALYESRPGAHSRAATAAAVERMETAWLRRIGLHVLAGR